MVTASVLAALVVTLVLLPNPWAILAGLVVGGAIGGGTAGLLLVNGQRPAMLEAPEKSSEQLKLESRLDGVDRTVRARASDLPPAAQGQLRMMIVGLGEIVERWPELERLPEHREGVRRMVERHLPRTLEVFLALPDSEKPRYAAEFKEQVGVLAEAVAKTRDRVVAKDLQALRANRWLLEEALTDPEERLFRRHGL
ncbi:hypothetical protein [Nesterenkonia marinintestina]|uniref:hypothetical protein n=1 Tax=Nesterenkonia marinintestina TaxID=2979865 RepID=UPI0021C1BFC2|nr:hypothetical protein [Nesterenkonia sp. GX14115]